MKHLAKKIFITALLLTPMVVPVVTFADVAAPANSSSGAAAPANSSSGAATPANSSSGTVSPSQGFSVPNPINVKTFCGLIQKILTYILIIGAPIASLFLVLAGFRFVTSRGNATKLQNARENLLYVLMGVGIFFAAWLLGQVIANTIKAITPAGSGSSSSTGTGACN